jgi:hypothetical protein
MGIIVRPPRSTIWKANPLINSLPIAELIRRVSKAAGRTYISISIKPFQNRIKNFIIVIKTVMKVFYI